MFYYYDHLSERYEKFDFKFIYILVAMIVIMLVTLSNRKPKTIVKKKYITEEMSVIIKDNEFTKEKFYDYIKMCGIRFPHIVYAQAVLESGNFTSYRFLEHNNAFGMKVARRRPTTASAEYTNHASYDSWMLCVQDYALYQSAYLKDIRTEDGYFKYLGQNYAESDVYVQKLKQIISNNKLK